MRTVGGILLGLALFFPGTVLLRWLTVNVVGAEGTMTLTDRLLAMIVILLCVLLVRGTRPAVSRSAAQSRRTSRSAEYPAEPQLEYLPGEEARHERRRPTGRRRTTTSRRDGRKQ